MGLLVDFRVETAVDVRSFPSSRRHPWFNRKEIERSLLGAGIGYVWLKELGGFRKPRPGPSPHTALGAGGFKNYADAMDSASFARGAERLVALGLAGRTVCFCAEKDPSNCHRRFLSDLLRLRGFDVIHIIDAGSAVHHTLHPDLVVRDGKPVYSGAQGRFRF